MHDVFLRVGIVEDIIGECSRRRVRWVKLNVSGPHRWKALRSAPTYLELINGIEKGRDQPANFGIWAIDRLEV